MIMVAFVLTREWADGPAIAAGVDNDDNEGHLAREVDLDETGHVEAGGTILAQCCPSLGDKGISILLVPMCMVCAGFVASLH